MALDARSVDLPGQNFTVSVEETEELSPKSRQNQAQVVIGTGANAQPSSTDDDRCCTTRVLTAYVEFVLRHPYVRLFTTLMVIVANFMLYAEDPMAHSYAVLINTVDSLLIFSCCTACQFPHSFTAPLVQ